MDTRYQIEEMISQDDQGVVFQGTDSVTGVIVAMRRFIASGGKDVKVGEAEQQAYSDSIAALKQVSHPSLRRVLAGGCDPVDEMPYLVTRWCEGEPLNEWLSTRDHLDPGLIRHILDQFIDANTTINNSLSRKGLWLESTPASILLRSLQGAGELPTVVFWLCPWQWLHEEESGGELMALADLAEALLGGPRKIAGENAQSPLVKWIKEIRKEAIKSLDEARAALAILDIENQPAAAPHAAQAVKSIEPDDDADQPTDFDTPGLKIEPTSQTAPQPRAVLPEEPTSPGKNKAWGIAVAVILVGTIVFFALRPANGDSGDVPESAHQPNTALVAGNTVPMIDNTAGEEYRQFILRRGYYTIEEVVLLKNLDKEEVTFRGRLANVRNSSSGLTLYLDFSADAPIEEPRVFAKVRNSVDGIRKEDLEPLVGRLMEIHGPVDIEPVGSTRRPRVELIDRSRLRLLDEDEDYQLR